MDSQGKSGTKLGQGLDKLAEELRSTKNLGAATVTRKKAADVPSYMKAPTKTGVKGKVASKDNVLLAQITIPDKILVQFTRHLATLQMAGVHLMRSIDVLTNQPECPKFGKVVEAIRDSIHGGKSMSFAFSKFPKIFRPLYISMIRVGETQGALGESLGSIADFLEKDEKIKAKVKSAMTYPIIVFGVACIIAFLMVNYLLPHFVEIFEGMHAELPLITKILIEGVRICQSPFFMLALPVCIVVGWMQIKAFLTTDNGRLMWDSYKIHMPVFGQIFHKVAIVRLTRSLGTLLGAGISTATALELGGAASGNERFKLVMMECTEGIKNGRPMSDGFKDPDLFEPVIPNMIKVGEETGRMDIMLNKLANYYEMEVEHLLNSISALIEPIMIMGTGFMVGFVVLAIFLPLYGLISQMGS
jgi:type IV pilus assembly protein PilC